MATTKKPVGTGHVNLSRVLDANRAGANRMGQELSTQVSQAGAQAQAGIRAGQRAFNVASYEATPQFNQDADLATSRAGAAAPQYGGPKSWEDAGVNTAGLTSQVARANDSANALTSEGGRAALIREKNPNATAGGLALDSFLAGQGGGDFQALKKQYGGLSAALANARGESTGVYQDALAESNRVRDSYAQTAARYEAGQRYNQTQEILRRNAEAARIAEQNAARQRAARGQPTEVEELDRRDKKRSRFEEYEP